VVRLRRSRPEGIVVSRGIAYPIRAEIPGTAVWPVRHCVFSTGRLWSDRMWNTALLKIWRDRESGAAE